MKYLNIFIAFFRSGILGYGGGPSSIPLVYDEVVKRYKWMDDEDFSDVLALGNTLPGPIATKMAGYIGYRVGGIVGMLVALIATILPTAVLLILFLTVLQAYKDIAWVNGISKAVVPVVGVMMGVLTWDFIKKSKGYFGWLMTTVLVIVSLIVLQVLSIHPGILIAGLLAAALLKKSKQADENLNKKVKTS
ncbi:chromate transporter [Caldibacillus lycopersici]|uniref:Chromate transporter n=1 Tax=Perspicuibacillus lycopersici TaxID=1325689 RepID=A0AAE3LMI5_9BACI|nr:chromate transporter [Perspicuibacillus lycopersici]MCU9612971.1 chromate transporter [Perspicuibacillus lycopersici]